MMGTTSSRAGLVPDVPLRQRAPRPTVKPPSEFARRCHVCGSDFLALAPGKTGERGIWRDWHWFCSIECSEAQP